MTSPSPLRKLDRDKLSMVTREDAAEAAYEALFPIQDRPPEALVAGIALLFHAVCTKVGLDPEDLYRQGGKMLRDQEGSLKTNNALQSLRDWASIRLLGRDTPIS